MNGLRLGMHAGSLPVHRTFMNEMDSHCKNLIILGLLTILLAIIILLAVSFSHYNRQNRTYIENLRLVERQNF